MKSWLYYNGDYIAQILLCIAGFSLFSGIIWGCYFVHDGQYVPNTIICICLLVVWINWISSIHRRMY